MSYAQSDGGCAFLMYIGPLHICLMRSRCWFLNPPLTGLINIHEAGHVPITPLMHGALRLCSLALLSCMKHRKPAHVAILPLIHSTAAHVACWARVSGMHHAQASPCRHPTPNAQCATRMLLGTHVRHNAPRTTQARAHLMGSKCRQGISDACAVHMSLGTRVGHAQRTTSQCMSPSRLRCTAHRGHGAGHLCPAWTCRQLASGARCTARMSLGTRVGHAPRPDACGYGAWGCRLEV